MEVKINITADSCTICGKCVRVCPSMVLVQNEAKSAIEIVSMDRCIVCGHCVAVCPTNSIVHSEFPPEKVHEIDYSLMPTPEQVMLLCKSRRSNRAFSKKAVPNEFMDLILEAAHRAPTASNVQQVEFTLVTDPVMIEQIKDFTIDEFSKLVKFISNPFVKPFVKTFMPGAYRYIAIFKRMKEEHENGRDVILRGATSVLFIHAPLKNRFGAMDCNLAYQNGSLMAESLGVSQVYTGFVCVAIKRDKKNKLAKMLGIDGTIHAGMAMGMPLFKYPKYIDRRDIKVTRINETASKYK
ncbi:MAG: nitroreductase family protein [Rikenellaceae bacterium]